MKSSVFTIILIIGLLFANNVRAEGLSVTLLKKWVNYQITIHSAKNVTYSGPIYHIFFHSLIVYPERAYGDKSVSQGYKDWMITRDEFQRILPELYKNNFVLIDIKSLYSVRSDGTVIKKSLYLPKGKKPLILSIDDLSYYKTLVGHGFADKLVLDANGNVATEIVTTNGRKEITRDGDIVPILDDFVAAHPDFSVHGAKGIIAVTGYEGILGYRTNSESATRLKDIEAVKPVVEKLTSTGWRFASHSYSHAQVYSEGTVSLQKVIDDANRWDAEVRPLVGGTDIFIGPFGQIFKKGDPRREYLNNHGFHVFCGVGMDKYFEYSATELIMNRADIDGYRLSHPSHYLKEYFDATKIMY